MTYQKISLKTQTINGPAGLPKALQGLDAATLADLGKSLNPCPAEYDGFGYFPIGVADAVPDGKVPEGVEVQMVEDAPKYVHIARDKTEEELAESIAQEQAEQDRAHALSPARFSFLLAITGLEDVWTSLETHVKATDLSTYAMLRAHKNAASFRLSKTLAILKQLKPMTDRIAPDTDLSEKAIRAAWTQAENVPL